MIFFFQKKGFTLSFVLKVRVYGAQKQLIRNIKSPREIS